MVAPVFNLRRIREICASSKPPWSPYKVQPNHSYIMRPCQKKKKLRKLRLRLEATH